MQIPNLPPLSLQMTSMQSLMTSERSHLFALASHLHLSLSPSPSLCCSVEFSKPSQCCSAQRDGEAEDEKKAEERKG